MTYIQGFVIPVPAAKQEAYRQMAADAAPLFAEYGAERMIECWGDDVPDGKVTDMKRAVQATGDEVVVFSWVVWPDRATCDAAAQKMMTDDRMKPPPEGMPFDGKRMFWGGFAPLLETGGTGDYGYVDGVVVAVPGDAKDAYRDHAEATGRMIVDAGALRVVDGWGEDVPDGKVTDFRRAVQATEDEAVAFGWVEWPDKATRDAGWAKLMADPAMNDVPMPFDGKRMIMGGFRPIFDSAEG